MDKISRENRSRVMSKIRKTDTSPELAVRRALHAQGLRYALHRRDLPGTPDVVFHSAKVAVQVHGCFWHQHEQCSLARRPKSRLEYWLPKLARNIERDAEATAALVRQGWSVRVIWECETQDSGRLAQLTRSLADTVRRRRAADEAVALGATRPVGSRACR
ncbi:MAG TPA: very short patch repair endonuclease [Planctomycetota bacterium]|nr:very short patch repair endonuclease [Planctomycetota bacterium]